MKLQKRAKQAMSETVAVATVGTEPAPLQEIEQRVEDDLGHVPEGGLATSGETNGTIELHVPNLLPTDNVVEVHEAKVHRIKIPVRIKNVDIFVVDNGFKVRLPHAGQQSMYGPDGAEHVFTDKTKMLEFVAMVIGQVTYQYREVEADTFEKLKRRRAGSTPSRSTNLGEDIEAANYETHEEARGTDEPDHAPVATEASG